MEIKKILISTGINKNVLKICLKKNIYWMANEMKSDDIPSGENLLTNINPSQISICISYGSSNSPSGISCVPFTRDSFVCH